MHSTHCPFIVTENCEVLLILGVFVVVFMFTAELQKKPPSTEATVDSDHKAGNMYHASPALLKLFAP